MNLLCKLFGHKLPLYHGEPTYGRVVQAGMDGIGTKHARVMTECDRCGEMYVVVNIHMPKEKKQNE